MRRLLDAGMRVFADRGFHAARVDDIVRAARTSHGTFYLYFANKEDLLRALATECAQEMDALADTLGPVGPDAEGYAELRSFLDAVLRDLPPVRADHARVDGGPRRGSRGQCARREGVHRHRDRARPAHARGRRAGRRASISALMALLERVRVLPRVAPSRVRERRDPRHASPRSMHRGFFAAPVAV